MSSKGRKSIDRQPFRAGQAGVEQILGSRQSMIMEYLWAYGAQSPGELHRALEEIDGVAYTTVHTELGRLLKKGFVRKQKGESRYGAVLTREQFMNATVNSVLQGLMQSNRSAAIHGFVDLIFDDEDAYEELQRTIRERTSR
ncbi:MAG: BlaI/MecI/CopY family transcriptional regulator [Candidatus Eremiobacteraeota bacterium]|nr:BlaI/MecI/CopY family transcriptional regulator [Candidatus Eremiobacteraeota bacterium]